MRYSFTAPAGNAGRDVVLYISRDECQLILEALEEDTRPLNDRGRYLRSALASMLRKVIELAIVALVVLAGCSSTSPAPDAGVDAARVDARPDAGVDAELAGCTLDASVVPCTCAAGGICRTATTSDACARGEACGP